MTVFFLYLKAGHNAAHAAEAYYLQIVGAFVANQIARFQ